MGNTWSWTLFVVTLGSNLLSQARVGIYYLKHIYISSIYAYICIFNQMFQAFTPEQHQSKPTTLTSHLTLFSGGCAEKLYISPYDTFSSLITYLLLIFLNTRLIGTFPGAKKDECMFWVVLKNYHWCFCMYVCCYMSICEEKLWRKEGYTYHWHGLDSIRLSVFWTPGVKVGKCKKRAQRSTSTCRTTGEEHLYTCIWLYLLSEMIRSAYIHWYARIKPDCRLQSNLINRGVYACYLLCQGKQKHEEVFMLRYPSFIQSSVSLFLTTKRK